RARAQRRLLGVLAVAAPGTGGARDVEARSLEGGQARHRQLRLDAARMSEHQVRHVLRGALRQRRRIDRDAAQGRLQLGDRAEQLHRLVDEMRAEVEQDAAALRYRGGGLPGPLPGGLPPLETGLEGVHVTERAVREQTLEGEEVRVVATVLEDAQAAAER